MGDETNLDGMFSQCPPALMLEAQAYDADADVASSQGGGYGIQLANRMSNWLRVDPSHKGTRYEVTSTTSRVAEMKRPSLLIVDSAQFGRYCSNHGIMDPYSSDVPVSTLITGLEAAGMDHVPGLRHKKLHGISGGRVRSIAARILRQED